MGFINIEQLVALRTAKGWDQKQLADAAGVDRSVISRLERGLQADCRVSVLVSIATALNIQAESLILNYRADDLPNTIPELEASILRLRQQSFLDQRRAALIIDAYLKGLSEDETKRRKLDAIHSSDSTR